MLDKIASMRAEFARGANLNKKSNAYIGLIVERANKLELEVIGPGPCHGSFQKNSLTYTLGTDRTAVYTLSAVQQLRVSTEDAKMFIEWLVQRSPWNEMFLTKDVDDILKHGYVSRTDLPDNFIVGGYIASRLITESYNEYVVDRFAVFKEMIKAGASETEAFMFAHMYASENKKKTYPILLQPLNSGHATFSIGNRGKNYFKNFLTARPVNPGPNFNVNRGYNSRIYDIWGSPVDTAGFLGFCRKIKPRSSKEATNYNIFEKPKASSYLIANLDELKDIVVQLKEEIYAA